MASKAMWEVDPETRSKLSEIQKTNSNNICIDCSAPSPQWASPKFGIFICLTCAGIHRGLGVHISFVRSITMDAFKAAEIERMRFGGNKTWKEFFEKHPDNLNAGITWDDTTVAERYGSSVGEEWKERLSAKVEGREYVPGEIKKSVGTPVARATPTQSRSATPSGGRMASPSLSSAASAPSGGVGGKAKVDDKYFSKLGAENANRPEDLHPSQGGKYAGFGSEMPAPPVQQGLPGFDDLQKDPVKALTRGWGWLGGVVGKGVQDVNEGYIKPTAQKLAEADLATTARLTAAQFAKTAQTGIQQGARGLQTGTKGASEAFNRFVEGEPARRQAPLDETKRDFWDSFGKPDEPASVGTRGMKSGGGGSGPGGMEGAKKKDEDNWDKW